MMIFSTNMIGKDADVKKITDNTGPCEKIQTIYTNMFKFWIWQCH